MKVSTSVQVPPSKPAAVSRRDVVKRLAATGVTVTAASQIANGAAALAQGGGFVRFGLNGANTGDGLDPALPQDVYMASLGSAIRDRLVEIDERGRPAPALATEWEISPKADSLSLRLRKDVLFHNAKPLSPEDVVASINHHRGEATKSPIKILMDQVRDIRADGNDRITIRLNQSNADFIYYLGSYDAVVGPSKDGAVDWRSGVGTGPYVLKRFEPGVHTALSKNQDYYRNDRGGFEEMELIAINDEAARVTALISGEVDFVSYVPPRLVERLMQVSGIEVREVPSMLHYTIPMDTTAPPFDDNHVRMALKHAIDRQEILDKILLGHGYLGNDHPVARSQAYYSDLPQRAFDPDKARFYLNKSGIGQLSVDLHVSDAAYAGATDTAVLYSESAKRCGIDIRVVRAPQDGYWSQVWMKKPFCFSWSGGRPTIDWMLSQHYEATAAYNETRWNDAKFGRMLKEARSVTDEQLRSELYHEMQVQIRDQGGAIIPVYANHIMAHSNAVTFPDRRLGGIWTLDNYRALNTLTPA